MRSPSATPSTPRSSAPSGRRQGRAGSVRAAALAFAFAGSLGTATPLHALAWPDVAERVEHDLAATDPATRRAAARDLRLLGPARGVPLALQALGDADTDVRLAAADASIRLRAAGATEIVAGWLNAPEARVRRKACEVARALPNPRAVAPLARTLGDTDPEVRAEAAEALGRQASADAVAPLLGRLDDPTPAVRIQIVGALARLGDPRAVVPLVGKVEDSSPDVRQAVVRALGDLGDARASSALVLALRDPNPEVRRDALGALGRLHAGDAVDAIAPFVADPTPSLRLAAIAALGTMATPQAVHILVMTLGIGDDGVVSLEPTPVRDALVAAGSERVTAPLHALLAGSPSPQAATSAAWVLGALRARGEAAAIIQAMRRGALPTAAGLHALAGAGGAGDVPVVLEFVDDPSPVVRSEALGAAMALLDPTHPDGRAVEPLAAALRDARPSTAERARIASLLGRTGAARAAPLLVELTHAQDSGLRIAAIDALGQLPQGAGDSGTRADDALLEALTSADAAVRVHAAMALGNAGGERAREALLTRLDGGDEVDRAAVLTALAGVLSRVPTDASIAKLEASLVLAAGPERDAILESLGRAPLPSAVQALARAARSDEPADRRTVAATCAAHGGDAVATNLARALLADPDPTVRAEAAWALGTLGDASGGADVANLEALTKALPADGAANAAAAIGRITARGRAPDLAARALCPLVADPRAMVRANALAGLALAKARCQDGAAERAALADDPSEDVRSAAARAVARTVANAEQAASDADVRALERCTRRDPSSAVAARCQGVAAASAAGAADVTPARTHAALVYVVPDGFDAPRPNAPYSMVFADGTLRSGATDRRGAVVDPVAPEGEVSLRRRNELERARR